MKNRCWNDRKTYEKNKTKQNKTKQLSNDDEKDNHKLTLWQEKLQYKTVAMLSRYLL